MLQAFLPLPAFYLLYLLGARVRWWQRVAYLGLATVVLLAVSLSWAVAVDLTPPEDRPYIGSSENNTVMELITGHNGTKRLNVLSFFDPDHTEAGDPAAPGGDARLQPGAQGGSGGQRNPPIPPQPGNRPAPAGGNPQGSAPAAGGPGQAGGGRSSEVGELRWLRLFSEPLAGEAGWLLPMALLGIPLVLVASGRPWPPTRQHLALALWAGWLLPEAFYFTFNAGLWHAYYLIMLGPPLGALVGATVWALWRLVRQRRWLGWTLLTLAAGATLVVQIHTLRDYGGYLAAVLAVAVPLLLGGLALLDWATQRLRQMLARLGLGLAILSLVVAPLLWSGLTTLNEHPNVALPRSGPDTGQQDQVHDALTPGQDAILDYLLAYTDPDDYLVAALSSHDVSGYILETGRPALTFGGFNGGDNVVTVGQVAEMVEEGKLRYVLGGSELTRRKPEIGRWVESTCTAVEAPGLPTSNPGQPSVLYDCGG